MFFLSRAKAGGTCLISFDFPQRHNFSSRFLNVLHGGFPQIVSIKPLISDRVVFERSQQVSKNGQEIKTLTFLSAINFLEKFWF